MNLEQTVRELSEIERKTLAVLSDTEYQTIDDIARKSGLPKDSVRRAVVWLFEKKLADRNLETKTQWTLSPAGRSSLSNALPEKLFIEALAALGGNGSLENVHQKSQLNRSEFNAAMGLAKANAWISIIKKEQSTELSLTGLEQDLLKGKYALEQALRGIAEQKTNSITQHTFAELKKRGLANENTASIEHIRLSSDGAKALPLLLGTAQRAYNVEGSVPELPMGKKHPYGQFLRKVSQKLVEMGFIEMETPLITQEFYNFDVLFQPQNHPARSWTDTYQLKQPTTGKLPGPPIVSAIKAAHENGGKSTSKGWQYQWDPAIAARLMPSAHATAHSARQLVSGVSIPGKYFAISRCFRPDIVDATHLIEFNQMDGFIVGEDLNFRHLLGMLKQFAIEFAGAKEVRFVPSYYPFTEPSVQLNARHPEIGWIELGGAGMFRPEILQNLGIKQQAIAWGIGIDRLAMLKLGIKDIRYLFSDDLQWLRKQSAVIL